MTEADPVILDKLKKILALAERGGTEEEAANAANMAAALALKYGIDLASVQVAGVAQPRGFKSTVIYEDRGGFEQWIINLVGGVVALHGGTTFYQASSGLTLYSAILREELVPVAKMTVEYLVKSVMRLNTEAVKGRNLTQPERAQFRKAFRLACSSRIRARLIERLRELTTRDEVAKEATGSTALVVLSHLENERKELQEWMQNQGFEFKKSRASGPRHLDAAGVAAGIAAGDRVGLDAQVSHDRASHKRLNRS